MKRALICGAAAVAVAGGAAPSFAAPSVPAPTLSITTSVQGQALPASPTQGSWTVTNPGRRATLSVSGPVASGSVTTVRSSWTSAWRWAPRHKIAIYASVENNFDDVAGTAEKNRVAMVMQARRKGHHWQTVMREVMSHSAMTLTPAAFGSGVGLGMLQRERLQWRVLMTATFTDTSTEGLTETVRVA